MYILCDHQQFIEFLFLRFTVEVVCSIFGIYYAMCLGLPMEIEAG
jgi:hypothetical protein